MDELGCPYDSGNHHIGGSWLPIQYCLPLWCFHIFWYPNSAETSACMWLILFQPVPKTLPEVKVHAVCVSLIPFVLFHNSQVMPKYAQDCVFTGKCCEGVSRPIVLFPNSQFIPSQVHAAYVFSPISSYSLDQFIWSGLACGLKTSTAWECPRTIKKRVSFHPCTSQMAKSIGRATPNELVVN